MAFAAGGFIEGPFTLIPDNSYILPKSTLILKFDHEKYKRLFWHIYGVEYPTYSKMHSDYRRKTRRRNRR